MIPDRLFLNRLKEKGSSLRSQNAWMAMLFLVVASFTPISFASGRSPEARRLGDKTFCDGLRDRGLVDLLEAYLTEYPVGDPVESLLLRRSLLLARHEDMARTEKERERALTQADLILDTLIQDYADDTRSFEWRMEKIKSIVFTHARPHYEEILFWGGSLQSKDKLHDLASTAIREIDNLSRAIENEYNRVDNLSPVQYDRLEREGHIDNLEKLAGEGDYIRWWAVFYRNLPLSSSTSGRKDELMNLLTVLNSPSGALQTDHSISHIQAQVLLLAEMTARQLGRPVEAIGYYNRIEHLFQHVLDPTEKRKLSWVMTLGTLERIRSFQDTNQYDLAREAIKAFGEYGRQSAPEHFGLKLLVAIAFRDTLTKEADYALRQGKEESSKEILEESSFMLEELIGSSPERKDEIYNILFSKIDKDSIYSSLPPLEQCVLLAGILHESTQGSSSYSRVISLGEELLKSNIPSKYVAELLYNIAIACLHEDQKPKAGTVFLRIAKDHTAFPLAEKAASQAVNIFSDLYYKHETGEGNPYQGFYTEALKTLINNYPSSKETRYWRFYYAQLLEEKGESDRAAEMYRIVGKDHEHSIEANFGIIRCRANSLKDRIASDTKPRPGEARETAHRLLDDADKISKQIKRKSLHTSDPVKKNKLIHLAAKILVIKAEIQVLKSVDLYDEALGTLQSFEKKFPRINQLMGRVLRARLLAYEGLGKLAEAEQLIPQYLKSDPGNAGSTLQQLLSTIRLEAARLEKQGRIKEALEKKKSAAVLARQVYDWSSQSSSSLPDKHVYALRLQLAEALLEAEDFNSAFAKFQECLNENQAQYDDKKPRDLRAISGMAEVYYRQNQYEQALPLFNRIVLTIEKNTPLWWNCLLRELQCRTELEEPPEGIIKVLSQYSHIFPEMGGMKSRKKLEALKRINEKRILVQ